MPEQETPSFLIDQIRYDFVKPSVHLGDLRGPEGNAFVIIGKVREALIRVGRVDLADEYTQRATQGDYEQLLSLVDDYCETDE